MVTRSVVEDRARSMIGQGVLDEQLAQTILELRPDVAMGVLDIIERRLIDGDAATLRAVSDHLARHAEKLAGEIKASGAAK